MEEEEKSLMDYASPQPEDLEMQKSDLVLNAVEYEIKPKIITMAAENPFRGAEMDNPYRHIECFTMLCNTVQQEGVPLDWFKWNLFPYSLADKAKRWHAVASFEVKGNWNELMKNFCRQFFPLSKIQHVRRQVITFEQGKNEGIDQAWERFNALTKQGPKLGFPGDVLLHTFYFSLTPECMQFVRMCAGGDLMEKTLTEAAQILQRISKGAAMQRDWEEHLSGKIEQENQVETLAGIFGKEAPEAKEEEPKHEKIEETTCDEEGSIESNKNCKPEEKV
jgi:hypothetical protein